MTQAVERGLVSMRRRLPLLGSLAWAQATLLAAAAGPVAAQPGRSTPRLLVYYGSTAQPTIAEYDIAILDSGIEADLAASRAPGGLLLGYLSLGEVHGGRDYAAALDREGLLLEPNPNWPEARLLDLRAPRWRERVVQELVPGILARGFDGLFIDTLDNAEALERRDPARFGGMVEGAAELIRALRRCFPRVPLMLNRGYAVLPRIAGQFDMLLGESVRATFDAAAGTYRLMPQEGYAWQLDQMRAAQRRDRRLRLFSLDYWDPADREGCARLYALQRANGFLPYVATFDLTRIVPET